MEIPISVAGRRSCAFPTARLGPTLSLPPKSAHRRPPGQSARQTTIIPLPSLFPATASSPPTAPSPDSAEAWRPRNSCSIWKVRAFVHRFLNRPVSSVNLPFSNRPRQLAQDPAATFARKHCARLQCGPLACGSRRSYAPNVAPADALPREARPSSVTDSSSTSHLNCRTCQLGIASQGAGNLHLQAAGIPRVSHRPLRPGRNLRSWFRLRSLSVLSPQRAKPMALPSPELPSALQPVPQKPSSPASSSRLPAAPALAAAFPCSPGADSTAAGRETRCVA